MHTKGIRRVTGWVLLVMLLGLIPAMASVAGAAEAWQRVGERRWLEVGEGINLSTGKTGTDLVMDGDTISAPNGMQVLSDSRYVDYDLVAPTSGYTTSLSTSPSVYSRLVVRLADGGYAQVRLGMASSSGLIYTGLFLEEWVVQKGSGKPEPILRGEVKLKLNSLQATGNGVPATLDVGPQLVGGQVMVPLRYVGETLKVQMRWDAREQKVSITGELLDMTLWVGKTTATINGQTVTLGQAPAMVQNRLLIPLMGAGEALAGKVSYDAASGAITMGGGGPAVPVAAAPSPAAAGALHYGAIWLTGYENGMASNSASARPDFYLTLNEDGTARVIQTVTNLFGSVGVAVNKEYKGTYTLNPLEVSLKLQPAAKGWETMHDSDPSWQTLKVTGTLSADKTKIENLKINGQAAQSGSATLVNRVPDPGEWR